MPSRLNVGRSNGYTVPGEGLFDSGEAVGLPPAAAAQVAQWMSYLPHAGQWDARLPRPAGR